MPTTDNDDAAGAGDDADAGVVWDFFGTLPTLPTIETFDSWGTDYYSDNWEPEFLTVFVSWQLRVTLDSICNSCDVCGKTDFKQFWFKIN